MVGKALETVCAFANTEGGLLVLGVADLKDFQGVQRVFGVEENPETVDELQRKLLTEFLPRVEGLRLQRLACTLHNGPASGAAWSCPRTPGASQRPRALDRERRHLYPARCGQPHHECFRGY
jgi:hypothetical protein